MPDFKLLIDALARQAPAAFYIALIGVIWQIAYALIKDVLSARDARQKRGLEQAKFEFQQSIERQRFEHQRDLENVKFQYEQLKWREQLAMELATRHLDARLAEYPHLWTLLRIASGHVWNRGALTRERCREAAMDIEAWRYGKGGLLAEETTREAAFALQAALWRYDETPEGFQRIRAARRLVRAALRADMGLGTDPQGQTIFDATAARHRIAQELASLQAQWRVEDDLAADG